MAHQIRTCIGCGQTDDHPRLVVAGTVDHTADITWHHDCWCIAHPDDGSDAGVAEMHLVVAHAAGRQGDELREYLLSPEHRKFKVKIEAKREAQLKAVSA